MLYLPELRQELLALKEKHKDLPADNRDMQAVNHLLNFIDKAYGNPPEKPGFLSDIKTKGLMSMYNNMATYNQLIAAEQAFLSTYLWEASSNSPLSIALANALADNLTQIEKDAKALDFIYDNVNWLVKGAISAIPGASKYLKKDEVNKKFAKYREEITLIKVTIPESKKLISEHHEIINENLHDFHQKAAQALSKEFATPEELSTELETIMQECQTKRAELLAAKEKLQANLQQKYLQLPITDIKEHGVFNPENPNSPLIEIKMIIEVNIAAIDKKIEQLDANIIKLGEHIENSAGDNANSLRDNLARLTKAHPHAIPLDKLEKLLEKTQAGLAKKQIEVDELSTKVVKTKDKTFTSQARFEEASKALTPQQLANLQKDTTNLIKALENAENILMDAIAKGDSNCLPHEKINIAALVQSLALSDEQQKYWHWRLQRQIYGETYTSSWLWNIGAAATRYVVGATPPLATEELQNLVTLQLNAAHCKQQADSDSASLHTLQQQYLTASQEITQHIEIASALTSAIATSKKAQADIKPVVAIDPSVKKELEQLLAKLDKYLQKLEKPHPIMAVYQTIRSTVDNDYKKFLDERMAMAQQAKTTVKGLNDAPTADWKTEIAKVREKNQGMRQKHSHAFFTPAGGKLDKVLSETSPTPAPKKDEPTPPSPGISGIGG